MEIDEKLAQMGKHLKQALAREDQTVSLGDGEMGALAWEATTLNKDVYIAANSVLCLGTLNRYLKDAGFGLGEGESAVDLAVKLLSIAKRRGLLEGPLYG